MTMNDQHAPTEQMSSEEMVRLCKEHTLYTWSKTAAVNPLPIARAEGVWIYSPEGERWLDFNSQLMCVNIGHGNRAVIDAIKRQLDELVFVYPQTATAVRARLSKLLAEVFPGDLNTFFYTLGGAESNENAVKMARHYTGRFKILSRYRSFHGGSHVAMQLTGDPRRWYTEPGAPGFIRVMDPTPYDFSFGATDEEVTANHLRYLEETIQYEGPDQIAAMFIETVTGTNGILVPPKGWLQGLRALLDKYGILLVADEVMCGFGRTGRMFAFEHDGVIPDIVTAAKGLTSAYLPLGLVAVRDPIAQHFRDNVYSGGLTYNSHPVCLAAAEAAVRVLIDEKMVENAARLEGVMRAEMERLRETHPSVKGGRCIGLFGMVEIQKNAKGELIAPYNGSHPAMNKLAAYFRANGLFTFVRWNNFMTNPPLCITEDELRQGFAIIDRGLAITDEAFEG